MYSYNFRLDRVVDGDTIDAFVDLGFGIWTKQRFRLWGIDTPEIRSRDKEEKAAGFRAKDRLEELLTENEDIMVQTSKEKGKFGRYLAKLFIMGNTTRCINKILVSEGHAVEYHGGKR